MKLAARARFPARPPVTIIVGERPPGDVWVFDWPGITVNHLYLPNAQGGRRLDPKAEQWREEAGTIVRCARVPIPAGDLALHVRAYPPDDQRRDADNLLKLLVDAVALGAGFDDSRIAYVGVEKRPVDRARPRLEAVIEAFDAWRARTGGGWPPPKE